MWWLLATPYLIVLAVGALLEVRWRWRLLALYLVTCGYWWLLQ